MAASCRRRRHTPAQSERTDEDKASMAKASLPLLPSLLVHAVVLAACFFHPCPAQP